jgi:hypothetical protein
MAKATITKVPSGGVASLGAPKRVSGSHRMKATWKVPSSLVKDDNKARAEGLNIEWTLSINGRDPHKVVSTSNERKTSSIIDLNNVRINGTNYTRDSFYPNTRKKLSAVSIAVTATNRKGMGDSIISTRKFKLPLKPKIDPISFNAATGTVSTSIKTNAGNKYRERYDTFYRVKVLDTSQGDKEVVAMVGDRKLEGSKTDTDFSVSYDVANYQQLSYDEYVKITVTARSRGYAGKSRELAKRVYYVSYPAQASILGIDVASKRATEKCTVRIDTNHSSEHPVDQVRLEYLVNSDYTSADQIPAEEAGWQSSDIVDNKSCTALSISVSELIPSAGKHTWIRVKTIHANEEVLYRYSDAMEVTQLFTEASTAEDDEITIIDAVAGKNGQSAVVRMGWNADGTDDSTGTELSWSNEEDTWRSTEEPESYEFTWSDGAIYDKTEDSSIVSGKEYYTRSGTGTDLDPYVYTVVADPVVAQLANYYEITYHDSAELVVKNLEEGTRYFFKARRYLESDDGRSYSAYSKTEDCMTSDTPESVVASAEKFIASGKPLAVRWTLSSVSQQTAWKIVDATATDKVIAEGESNYGFAQISAERLSEVVDANNSVSFIVQATTGSEYVSSDVMTVTVIEAPEVSLVSSSLANDVLTRNALSFTVSANRMCDLVVIVSSQGARGQFPQGILTQTDGDTIFSDLFDNLEWTENNGVYTASFDLPTDLDFWDLGSYDYTITAVDGQTQLQSEPIEGDFAVEWEHQAVTPEDAVKLKVIDQVDEQDDHLQAVQIELTPPAGSRETDVYDIYRMDVESPRLIGEGFPLTYTVIDRYAPFGEDVDLKYRVALRTADGDVEYADLPYLAPCENLRFDWQGGSLELPFGLAYGDTFKKDVDVRRHMDGSNDAYWNKNIDRKSSLSSDVIKIVQPRAVENARLLARYAGAVFVRMPNGSAFEADVQVTNLSKKNEEVVAVAFDAQEVGLTQEFLLPVPSQLIESEE